MRYTYVKTFLSHRNQVKFAGSSILQYLLILFQGLILFFYLLYPAGSLKIMSFCSTEPGKHMLLSTFCTVVLSLPITYIMFPRHSLSLLVFCLIISSPLILASQFFTYPSIVAHLCSTLQNYYYFISLSLYFEAWIFTCNVSIG